MVYVEGLKAYINIPLGTRLQILIGLIAKSMLYHLWSGSFNGPKVVTGFIPSQGSRLESQRCFEV